MRALRVLVGIGRREDPDQLVVREGLAHEDAAAELPHVGARRLEERDRRLGREQLLRETPREVTLEEGDDRGDARIVPVAHDEARERRHDRLALRLGALVVEDVEEVLDHVPVALGALEEREEHVEPEKALPHTPGDLREPEAPGRAQGVGEERVEALDGYAEQRVPGALVEEAHDRAGGVLVPRALEEPDEPLGVAEPELGEDRALPARGRRLLRLLFLGRPLVGRWSARLRELLLREVEEVVVLLGVRVDGERVLEPRDEALRGLARGDAARRDDPQEAREEDRGPGLEEGEELLQVLEEALGRLHGDVLEVPVAAPLHVGDGAPARSRRVRRLVENPGAEPEGRRVARGLRELEDPLEALPVAAPVRLDEG